MAQVTKTGFVFVLDRETGKPLFPVEERPVPQSRRARRGDLADAALPVKPRAARPPRPITRADLSR